MKSQNMKTVVFGGTGLVGSHFISLSKYNKNLIVPVHKDVDIANKKNVKQFFNLVKPDCVINFAAYINIDDSEKERGDIYGPTWQTNYIGVKNLVDICKKNNIFFIQISTDAIFPGTKKYPGPYHEFTKPAYDGNDINWYGFSKLKAEEETKKLKNNFAIIRISHPFGNPKNQRDLISKTIRSIKNKQPSFKDQMFTPTFIFDLTKAIRIIHKKRASGIFHVGCKNLVSRFEFNSLVAKIFRIKEKVFEGSMQDFMKTHAPRTRLGGLKTEYTEKTLGITFYKWQDALNSLVE